MNSFSKFYNINKTFEVDYWGISNKNLYSSTKKHSIQNNVNNQVCIFIGGGITKKSQLDKEWEECERKGQSLLKYL